MSRLRDHRRRLDKLTPPPARPPVLFELDVGLPGSPRMVRWLQRDDGTSTVLSGPDDQQPETDIDDGG